MRYFAAPSAELELWAVSSGASVLLVDLEPYEACRVAGLVKRLRVDPVQGVIEARIADGTGVVVARWAIRRPVPEFSVVPGRGVVLEGVASPGDNGELILRDPVFRVLSFPEVA